MHYNYILEKGCHILRRAFPFPFYQVHFFFEYKMKRCSQFFLFLFAQLAADLRLELGVIAFKTALINMKRDHFKGGFNLVS